MTFLNTYLLLLFLQFIYISYSDLIPISNHGTFVHDLYGSSEGDFAAMASQWTFNNPLSVSRIISCEPHALNGPGISEAIGSFERTYSPLTSHDIIYFQVTTYMLDNWVAGDIFSIQFDDQQPIVFDLVAKKNVLQLDPGQQSLNCGNPGYPDFHTIIFIKLTHTAPSVKVKFFFELANGPDLASLVIRDLVMQFRYRSPEDVDRSYVLYASDPDPSFLSCTTFAPCSACDSRCNYCFGPAPYQCYYYQASYYFDGSGVSQCSSPCGSLCNSLRCSTCAGGYTLFRDSTCRLDSTCAGTGNIPVQNDLNGQKGCETPCQSAGTFVSWDTTTGIPCQTTCNSPYIQRTEGVAKFCDFPCTAPNEYLYWDNSCRASCIYNTRFVGAYKFCETPCQSAGIYLSWDTSIVCQATCNSPYIPRTEVAAKFCDFPCTTTTGEYLYWDDICRPTCIYNTREVNGYKFCETPCQKNNTFLSWDNTCQQSCSPPYKTRIEGAAKFCDFPCTTTTGEYLYWDDKCQATCPYYTELRSGYKFCLPCQEDYFRYPDTKCLPNCPAIFPQSQKIGPTTICEYPCRSISSYYYLEDRSCKLNCEYPYAPRETVLCTLDLSEDDIKQTQALADMMGAGGTAIGVTASAASVLDFSDPDAMCSTSLIKMLWYIRYMKVKYPPKLQVILDLQKFEAGLTTYMPSVPSGISNNLVSFPLPEKFERYKHNSNFLINFWTSLILMLIILAAIALLMAFNYILKGAGIFHTICKKVKEAVQWNLFLTIFITFYDSLILISSFEFRTLEFYNALTVISFILCICINIVGVGVFSVAVRIINSFRTSNKKRVSRRGKVRQVSNTEDKWQSYQFLLANYKENQFVQQVFIPIFIVRISLYNAIIGLLFEYPLVQAVLITVLSGLILVYLAIRAPMKLIFKQIQQIIQELIILIVNICVLVLAVMDSTEKTSYDTRKTLGDAVIVCNIIFPIISSALSGLNTLSKLWALYQAWRAKKNAKNVSKLGGVSSQQVKKDHKGVEVPKSLDMAKVLRKPVVSQLIQLEKDINSSGTAPIGLGSLEKNNSEWKPEIKKRGMENNSRGMVEQGSLHNKIANVLKKGRKTNGTKRKEKYANSSGLDDIQVESAENAVEQGTTNITALDETTLPPQYTVKSRQVFKLSEVLRQQFEGKNGNQNDENDYGDENY